MSRKITCHIERCLGCHTCELACAIAHSTVVKEAGKNAADPDLAVVMAAAGEKPGYRIHVEHFGPQAIPLSCQHCEEAACVLACPTGAVHRNAPGKPVLVEEERCIGCSMCVQACPFGVMSHEAGRQGGLQVRPVHRPLGQGTRAGLRVLLPDARPGGGGRDAGKQAEAPGGRSTADGSPDSGERGGQVGPA